MNVLNLPAGTEEDESIVRYNITTLTQVWHKKGRRYEWHRVRGPACIYSDGEEVWYRDGNQYTPTAHEKMMWELRKKNECS